MVEDGEVLRDVASAFVVKIFPEADVEQPVQFVFDSPVLADHKFLTRAPSCSDTPPLSSESTDTLMQGSMGKR